MIHKIQRTTIFNSPPSALEHNAKQLCPGSFKLEVLQNPFNTTQRWHNLASNRVLRTGFQSAQNLLHRMCMCVWQRMFAKRQKLKDPISSSSWSLSSSVGSPVGSVFLAAHKKKARTMLCATFPTLSLSLPLAGKPRSDDIKSNFRAEKNHTHTQCHTRVQKIRKTSTSTSSSPSSLSLSSSSSWEHEPTIISNAIEWAWNRLEASATAVQEFRTKRRRASSQTNEQILAPNTKTNSFVLVFGATTMATSARMLPRVEN